MTYPITQPVYKLLLRTGLFAWDEKSGRFYHTAGVQRVLTIRPGDVLPEYRLQAERYLMDETGRPCGLVLSGPQDLLEVRPGPVQDYTLRTFNRSGEGDFFEPCSAHIQLQLFPFESAPADSMHIIAGEAAEV